jgi:hypothetical protein
MKPRGRPRLAVDEESVSVHFRLPAKQYDRTQKQADQARMPLSEWLRKVVDRACREKAKV